MMEKTFFVASALIVFSTPFSNPFIKSSLVAYYVLANGFVMLCNPPGECDLVEEPALKNHTKT